MWPPCDWQAATAACSLSDHQHILAGSSLSSNQAHFWLHKTKMAMAAMPNSKLQSGSRPTHLLLTFFRFRPGIVIGIKSIMIFFFFDRTTHTPMLTLSPYVFAGFCRKTHQSLQKYEKTENHMLVCTDCPQSPLVRNSRSQEHCARKCKKVKKNFSCRWATFSLSL